MAVLDTLEILIEADRSGLESQLKYAINGIVNFIDTINSEGINWEKILGATATPAIIAAVASAFALAITQSLNFQNSLATSGTAAGETSDQIAQTGQAALNLSDQTTSSAQDIANAMLQVSQVFGTNTQATTDITQAMAQLAESGFGNLNDIVAAAIPLFQQFGVTTEAQGIQVLTDLMHSAEAAKESIPSLADQFTSFSNQLPAVDKNVDTFNGLISTFGAEIQNVGQAQAQEIFQALATSSNSAVGPMELLGQSFGSIQQSLVNDGGLSAIENTSKTLEAMGPGASLVATQFGLSATQVAAFQVNSEKLPQIATDAQSIATNSQSIADAVQNSANALRALQQQWNTFQNSLTSDSVANALEGLLVFVQKIGAGFNLMITGWEVIVSGAETIGKVVADIATGNFGQISKDIMNENALMQTLAGQASAESGLGTGASNSFNPFFPNTPTNTANSNSTVNNNQNQFFNTFTIFNASNPSSTASSVSNSLYNQFQGIGN